MNQIPAQFSGEDRRIPRPRTLGKTAVPRKSYRPRRRNTSRVSVVLAFGIVATLFAFAVASGQFDRMANGLNAIYEDLRLGGA
jgi:hypothetical protein